MTQQKTWSFWEKVMNDQGLLALSSSLFITAFLGSWHCAAMCGPIACLAQNRGQLISYQFGRLTSYSLLGAFAGALGQALFRHSQGWVRTSSFFLLLLLVLVQIIHLGAFLQIPFIKRITGILPLKFPGAWAFIRIPWPQNAKNWIRPSQSGFFLGFLSFLLPCAWLYTFIAGAAATQSPWAGAFIMFLMALSGIPALSLAPQFFTHVLKGSPLRQKVLSLGVLSVSAIYALASHYFF